MNKKIHNNLNIENLIKTDSFKQLTTEQKAELLKNSQWFNQLDEYQQEQISIGLQANLDISIYAKTEFDWKQMCEIREGLENNLNVSIYAKEHFNAAQMFEIKTGLEDDLDVLLYAKSEYNENQMSQIRIGLKNNLDISLICENFDNSHKSCYYSIFMIPPANMFKAFFKQQKKVL